MRLASPVSTHFWSLLAGVLASVRLWSVHQQTSDWVLSPNAVPSKVQFADREYNCGPDPRPADHELSALTSQGKTAGEERFLRSSLLPRPECSSSCRQTRVLSAAPSWAGPKSIDAGDLALRPGARGHWYWNPWSECTSGCCPFSRVASAPRSDELVSSRLGEVPMA